MMRKWTLAGLGLLLVMAFGFGADAIQSLDETEASGTSTIRVNDLRGAYKTMAIYPRSQAITVHLYSGGSEITDFSIPVGVSRTFRIAAIDSVQIRRTTATIVDWGISDTWEYTPQIFSGGYGVPVDAQTFTLVNGFDMAAQKYRTFPTPLIPMQDFNYAALSIGAATLPDTLWYQVVMGGNPMDTLSVFAYGDNQGSNETVRYIVKADIPGATGVNDAAYISWPNTGVYMELPIFDYVTESTTGYPGICKYIGVRVATSNGDGVSDLKVTLTLAKMISSGVSR